MFVTFLYELDRTLWPEKWQRPFSSYLDRLNDLLPKLQDTVVFGEDDRVKEIAFRHNKTYVHKRKEEWDTWKNISAIQWAVDLKYKEDVPQNFSAEYNCIQLCKFDALTEAMRIFLAEDYVWIDGGLHSGCQPKRPIIVKWNNPLLHISLFRRPTPIQDFKYVDSFVMGGCFGGRKDDLIWLSSKIREENAFILANNHCANDQELLSIVFNKYPERFSTRRSFVIDVGNKVDQYWDGVTYCLNDDIPELADESVSFVASYISGAIVILVLLITLSNMFSFRTKI